MLDKSKNIAVTHRFWEIISAKDIDGYMSLFTSDAVEHNPIDKPPLRTPEARRANMQSIFDAFVTITAKADYVTTCGNRTANKWTVVGTTADGQEVTIEGIDLLKHDEAGLIEEMWGYYES